MTTTPNATTSRFVMLVLSVQCRWCKAWAGDVCRSVNGDVVTFPHMRRLFDTAVTIEDISKGDACLAAATAVVLGRVPTAEEMELAHQRGISYAQPWIRKARAGLDVNKRIDHQAARTTHDMDDLLDAVRCQPPGTTLGDLEG